MSNTVLLGSLPKYFFMKYSVWMIMKSTWIIWSLFPTTLSTHCLLPFETAHLAGIVSEIRHKIHIDYWEKEREEPVIVYCSVPGGVVPEGKLICLQHLITHLRFETASGGKPCTTIRTSWWSGSLASLSSEFSWAESSDIASSSGRTGHWTTKVHLWWVRFFVSDDDEKLFHYIC